MIDKNAQAVAEQLGNLPPTTPDLQAEIERLRRRSFVELEQVKLLHDWLEGKRKSRQCCRVVGESRTGKTVACDAYRLRHKPRQEPGKPPLVPVVYIQIPQECASREFFRAILEHLKYQLPQGRLGDIRNRTLQVLKNCKVEMLIIDEADRFKPKTFAEVRDIFDHLQISVVLVGTDRLNAVINKDEQVENRFCACYELGKLSGAKLTETIDIWEKKVLRLPVASNLASKNMLTILTNHTDGYIGLIDMVLRDAAIRALEKGLKKIDKKTLEEVASEYKVRRKNK